MKPKAISEYDLTEFIELVSIPYDYKTKDYSFEVLVNKFGPEENESATLFIPKYQREFIWDEKMKSRFIESVILGMPLTPFLVSEDEKGRLEIIDGSQRIRTLISFYNNDFKLKELKKIDLLNGYYYKDTPTRVKKKFFNRDFKVIVVNDKATLHVRQDIFDRINTSGKRASASEIRKGALAGSFYNLIIKLTDEPLFKELCPIPETKVNRGEREELLLRYFSYSDKYLEFKHDVSKFLDSYVIEMNKKDFNENKYISSFNNMLNFVSKYFEYGFKKEKNSKSTPRVRFEAISVGVHLALEINPKLKPTYMDWLYSEKFEEVTTSDASNNKDKLKNRVEFVRDCLLNKIKKESLALKHDKR